VSAEGQVSRANRAFAVLSMAAGPDAVIIGPLDAALVALIYRAFVPPAG
jgi:hypothetical protein